MNRATKQAIKKYGEADCRAAYELHKKGEGGSTIACMFGWHTNSADAAINAGREMEFEASKSLQRGNHSLVTYKQS